MSVKEVKAYQADDGLVYPTAEKAREANCFYYCKKLFENADDDNTASLTLFNTLKAATWTDWKLHAIETTMKEIMANMRPIR